MHQLIKKKKEKKKEVECTCSNRKKAIYWFDVLSEKKKN